MILPLSAPLCFAYDQTMEQEAKTIHDPPLTSFDRIARVRVQPAAKVALPSCSRFSRGVRKLCQKLEPHMLALLKAARATKALASAIEIKISRETGALHARNRAAVKRQDRALTGLNRRFLAAERAETGDGAAVATLMRGAGVSPTLSTSTASRAVDTVSRALRRLGIGRTQLASVLGAEFAPHAIDWLAALSR